MKYLTAIEASRRIGVAEKTIRLWIKEGKLEAHHPAKNRLAIAEADVERLAQERQLYYGPRPEMPSSIHTLPDVSAHDIDTLFTRIAQLEHQPEIAVLTRELGKLQAKFDVQDARIAELERRITELEGRSVPTQPIPPLPSLATSFMTEPQKRNVATSSPIPDDWMLCSDFFEARDIKETTYRRWLKDGIAGENFEFEEKPVAAGATKKYRYFTPAQQEQAISLLKKHGKLS